MASAPPLPPGFELESSAPQAPLQPIIPRTPPPQTEPQRRIDEGRAAQAPHDTARAAAEAARAAVEAQTAADNARRMAAQRQSLPETLTNIRNVIGNAREAQRLSRDGWFATGFGSGLGRMTGGTSGTDLDALLSQIGSNTAFDRLSRMRAESPTGGALGNVTERELELLQSTIASMDVSQSDAQFQRSMDDIINAYSTVYARLGGNPDDLAAWTERAGREVAAAVVRGTEAGASPSGGQPGGGAPPDQLTRGPGLPPLTQGEANAAAGSEELGEGDTVRVNPERDERYAAQLTAIARSGRSPEQINEWLRSQGLQPLTAEATARINEYRRLGRPRDIPAFGPNYEMGPRPRTYNDVVGIETSEGAQAGVANYMDAASFGAPALFSESYRRRIGDLRVRNPVESIIGSVAGSLIAPGGPRAGMTLWNQSLRSGGQGALYAFNSTGGDPVAGLAGGTIGIAAPGAFNLAGRGVRGAYNAVRGGDGVPNPGAMAAQELDIPLMPGDVGGPFTRRATAFGAQLPFSTSRITNAYEATNTAAQAARDRVASTVAGEGRELLGTEAAGEAARRGALSYRSSSRDQVGRAYDRAAELAGDTRIVPTQALERLDESIRELSESPTGAPSALLDLRSQLVGGQSRLEEFGREGNERFLNYILPDGRRVPMQVIIGPKGVAEISVDPFSRASNTYGVGQVRDAARQLRTLYPEIRSIRGQRQSGANPGRDQVVNFDGQRPIDFTVSGLRNLRTRLRDDFASQGLRGSDIERRAMQVVDALSDDINTGLTNAGRADAAVAYRAADDLHRARIDTLDSVIMPIIGRNGERSGEQIVQALQRAASGNSQRLQRFIGSLPANEARDVRATLIGQLGRATNSQQNAATDAFSLETFLTNYSAMTPSARRTVFGREGSKALSQLAEVADLRRQAGRFANRSNTGSVVGGVATGGSVYGGLPVLIGAAAAQYGMGRILTSPKLVRFLANMPRDPNRAPGYIGRLTRMARVESNPAIAQDMLGLRDVLLRAANDNISDVSRVAAESGPTGSDDR